MNFCCFSARFSGRCGIWLLSLLFGGQSWQVSQKWHAHSSMENALVSVLENFHVIWILCIRIYIVI